MAEVLITVTVVVVIMLAGVGFLIRGVLGPAGFVAYQRGISQILHQIVRFVRYTLRTHWQFWVGVVVGILGTLFFMSP